MDRLQTTSGELARRGFRAPRLAEVVLEAWAKHINLPLPLDDLAVVADPDLALDALERLAISAPDLLREVLANQAWTRRLLAVLGGSVVLGQHLVNHPSDVHLIDGQWRDWGAFISKRIGALDGVATKTDAADELRWANKAALCSIAAIDLTHPDPAEIVEEVGRTLADLADAVLAGALAIAKAEVSGHEQVRLVVIALGKCGARELNYLSDVDVLFVAEPLGDAPVDAAIEVATRLAASLTRICSAHTRAGTIWSVDAGLRPEGKAGPLVRTLASMSAYYAKWAKNWEFQAMLKARPAAGDLELGNQFVGMISPLVWRAGERPDFVAEARAMRARVISLIPPKEAGREVKLGVGGLRDTEFSVQLLQLVHGRADRRLQVRGTFDGLRALIDYGYIGRVDGAELMDAYRFQRTLEHRVQLRRLRRTHLIPDDPVELRALERSLGSDAVIERWRASSRVVARKHRRIFYSPLLEAVSRIDSEELRLSTTAAQTRLKALGFADPAQALRHIEALTAGVNRKVEIQRQLLPAMLGWFADGPNPDFGLLAFRQISEALGNDPWFLRAMRDEGEMAQRLAHICSSSRYAVDLVKRSPQTVQWLANDDELAPRSREEIAKSMRAALARHDDAAQAFESVRSQRRRELCRLAIGDILGLIDLDRVGWALSDLMAVTIDAALEVASRDAAVPPIGVVAMGRWGGREVGYASDADVWFVVPDDADDEAQMAATAALRRMSDLLNKPGPEPALEVDSELRPEGKGGPLVRTASSYRVYFERWAQTWERQALLRARAGAGNLELAQTLLAQLDPHRYRRTGLSRQETNEVRRLKQRVQTERMRGAPERNLKLGPGGLSDVEWTVQLLQLQHGARLPDLGVTGTLPAIEALVRHGLLSEDEGLALRDAWTTASRLRNLIMLVRGRASDSLPTSALDLGAIAELGGYAKAQASQLFEDYRRIARRASAVVDAHFWSN